MFAGGRAFASISQSSGPPVPEAGALPGHPAPPPARTLPHASVPPQQTGRGNTEVVVVVGGGGGEGGGEGVREESHLVTFAVEVVVRAGGVGLQIS